MLNCSLLEKLRKEKVYIIPQLMGGGLHKPPTYKTVYITPELSKIGQITL
jgi:hypothetical protein